MVLLPKAQLYESHIASDSNKSSIVIKDINSSLLQFIEKQKIKYYTRSDILKAIEPTISQQEAWQEILYILDRDWRCSKYRLRGLLSIIDYQMVVIQNRYIALLPNIDDINWGLYLIDTNSSNSLMLELPYPMKDNNMIETTIALNKLLEAKRVAICGIAKNDLQHPVLAQSENYNSLYYIFHRHYSKKGIISLYKQSRLNNSLIVFKDYIPTDLSLKRLKELIKDLKVSWGKGLKSSIEEKCARGGYAQLYLNQIDRILLISSQLSRNSISVIKGEDSMSIMVQNLINDDTISIAPKNSNLYIPPTLSQMLYMDRSILVPILKILSTSKTEDSIELLKYHLEPIKIAANILDYNLLWYQEKISGKSYLILYEVGDKKRYWGTYIFKIDKANPIMVQIPHPVYEAYTLEYGLELYEALDAKMILISGSTPTSNSDGSSDVLLPKNKDNIFNLVSQVLFRESGASSMNAISIRGKNSLEINQSPKAILAYDNGLTKMVGLNRTQQLFTNYLKKSIDLMIYDGSELTAGYGANAFEGRYLEESLNDTFNVLWLPFNMRYEYKRVSNSSSLLAQLDSMGVEFIKNMTLLDYIKGLKFTNRCIKKSVIDTLMHYLSSRDINDILLLNSDRDIRLKILVTKSNKVYIIILDRDGNSLYAVVKLYTRPPYKITINRDKKALFKEIKDFSMSNYSIMEFSDICKD